MTRRVLFHVQHLLGIGHVQRSLRIAEALVERGVAVTLVSGGPPVAVLDAVRGIEVVQLPPIRARDAIFTLVAADGSPVDDALRAARGGRLLEAFRAARPDVVVVEGFPFARRAFRQELDRLIEAARAAGSRVVCSVRDIPTVRDDPDRHREIVARVRRDFAAVLVHGDPDFIPFDVPFPPAAEIADRLRYTGYVTSSGETPGDERVPAGEIVVSVGGGAAGGKLLAAALAARRLGCCAERNWRVLTGTSLSKEAIAALRRDAPSGVAIERFRADFPALLRRCHVSVSQAGYNTVLDIVAARARSVLVPFAAERETEQSIRAEYLAARGAAAVVREAGLTAETLATAIENAAAHEPIPLALDTGGARRSAELIAEMIAK